MVTNLLILSGLSLAAATSEYSAPSVIPPHRIRLQLELTDGSRLIGEPTHATLSLPLHARFGSTNIPLSSVERFDVQKDGEGVVLQWSDGDRLTAVAGFKGFTMRTLFGAVTVPLPVVRRGSVQILDAVAPLKPVGVKVSGAYAHQSPEKSFDGSKGSAWSSGDWKGWIEFDLGDAYDLARIRFHLQINPSGAATHEVYVSKKPIGASPQDARLLQRFSGHRKDGDTLVVDCSSGIVAQYVQIRCPSSPGWFNIRELEVIPRK